MKKRCSIIFLILLLLVGILILSYPAISEYINQSRSSQAVQSFSDIVQSSPEVEKQLQLAKAYNEGLLNGLLTELNYDEILDFGDGIMGYICIPSIDVELPIYHGMDTETLRRGVGHMPGTAFPIGGVGNHSVLTGHTGLPGAKLFTDLVKLKQGDRFTVTVGNVTVSYIVDQIKTVLPTDGSDLVALPDGDYCTLLTCTPYGINSHRLLVRGRCIGAKGE